MRTAEQIWKDAREGSPFSNGTEGYAWMDNWCGRCIHDKPARNGHEENGCPLLLPALSGKTPVEWLDGPRNEQGHWAIDDKYHCIEFRDEDDGPPPPTEPQPTPPGQGELVPMEPYVGTRMFADVVAEVQTEDAR